LHKTHLFSGFSIGFERKFRAWLFLARRLQIKKSSGNHDWLGGQAWSSEQMVIPADHCFLQGTQLMKSFFSTTGWTSIVAVALSTAAVASDQDISLLDNTGWESFAAAGQPLSLAWSGEDESLVKSEDLLGLPRQIAMSDDDVNIEIVTALPAPEPSTAVLAGTAFGGVLCGRSLMARRRRRA